MTPCPPHHWRIAIPRGPVSKGRCRKCGERKMFKNYADTDKIGNWATMPMKKGERNGDLYVPHGSRL